MEKKRASVQLLYLSKILKSHYRVFLDATGLGKKKLKKETSQRPISSLRRPDRLSRYISGKKNQKKLEQDGAPAESTHRFYYFFSLR